MNNFYEISIKIMGVKKFARWMKTSEDHALFGLGMFYGAIIIVILSIFI